MIKSTQTKIILIIMVLAIIMFGTFGIYAISVIQNNPNSQDIHELKIVLGIIMLGFIIISLVIIWFNKKIISKPLLRLIQSAKQINEDQFFNDNTGDELNDLSNAFDVMNNGLKQNFNEVIRQKKQMETILLHMNDGILAFNMEGKIIHINPAAKKLLNLQENMNTFEKIFNKIDENINMERLIYLEDWTTSESKVNVEDKYLKLF